ncbi:MAG: phosphoribosylamine--glycine ligase [Acidobacteria bacterium]|nr:phosphoribosylamine--glycine ligase [Acidobacteriota bacterium]
MKVLVVGGGGREHALAWRLSLDPEVTRVVCAPGNPGISQVAECVAVAATDPDGMLALVKREGIDLTVVGPEAALERGMADLFRAQGHPILGPPKRAAALETSKVFSKHFMAMASIPTARYVVCDTADAALAAVSGDQFGFPVVVKADGLAGGKGVVVAVDRLEAEAAVRTAMVDRAFGAAGATLVIEECLTGPEVSFFVLADGQRAIALGSAEDHKRIFDGDRGPNTGGMGAFAPSPLMTPALETTVMRTIVQPVIDQLHADGGYRGFLYVSLMLTPDGPKVIEFNVRFGDPEAQVVLPLIEGRFAELLLAAAEGRLPAGDVHISEGAAVGVVLASAGYPGRSAAAVPIYGLETPQPAGVMIFHAGTARQAGQLMTAGGRVLTVVAQGPTHASAMERAYAVVSEVQFEGMQFRRDIGSKADDANRRPPTTER